MKTNHLLLPWLMLLLCAATLTASERDTPSGYEKSDTTVNFHRVVLHVDPLRACMGAVVINTEGFISPTLSCFVEGMYTFPLLSEKMYQGSGGVRFYYDSTHFWGLVAKTGKIRTHIPATKSDPDDYYLRIKYMSAGAYWGKNFIYRKKFDCTYRFGFCYPFKKETYWRFDRKPTGNKLTETMISLTAYLDGELSLRIPLPF